MTEPSENKPAKPRGVHPQGTRVPIELIIGLGVLVALVVFMNWTSMRAPEEVPGNSAAFDDQASPSPEVAAGPADTPQPATQPLDAPFESRATIDTLADKQLGWLTIAGQARSDEPSSAKGQYEKDNVFRIETTNTSRITIDLSRLPVIKGKEFVMHIDGQDFMVTPRKQHLLTFVRSPRGSWVRERKGD